HYQAALTIAREIGDRRGEGSDLGNLGNAYRNLGQVEKAIECMSQAAEIFDEIKSPNAALVRGWLEKLQQKS
ncbi:MAG: tetratricopeptide repeat protein, partial [Anaerolineae bacterium]|nr:tetratricopeptide repeat protein [Anaerolineae bacterium]